MSLDPDFIEKLSGTLGNVLKSHLEAEQSPSSGNDMGLDVFINDFEDEFPRDPDDPALGSYPTYSEEANRAAKEEPYGLKRGDRPKVWELNQPPPSRIRGWRVVDLYPNREVKGEFYRLAGTPSEIRMMAQLVRHNQEIVKRFANANNITFEQFWKEWESGFPQWNREPKGDLSTNYPLNDKTDSEGVITEAWRKQLENRPQYIEWSNPRSELAGVRVIEYFPSRSSPKTSQLFIGTDSQIIQNIIQYEYEGMGGETVSPSDKLENQIWRSISFKGKPQVTLWFLEQRNRKAGDPYLVEGQVSFRLIDKSEIASEPGSLLTKADLKNLANRISLLFSRPFYKWEKGKLAASYRHKELGYEMWGYFHSRSDARQLFERILQIRNHPFDQSRLFYSENANETVAYPEIPQTITVLGEQVKKTRYRPRATVEFCLAEISLGSVGRAITLIDKFGFSYSGDSIA